jgi:hypothetical protein
MQQENLYRQNYITFESFAIKEYVQTNLLGLCVIGREGCVIGREGIGTDRIA